AVQRYLARRTAARASQVLFVSQAARELAEAQGWLRPEVSRIVPYGVDTQRLMDSTDRELLSKLRSGPPYVLAVGSVMPHKNLHTLIDAMRVIRQSGRSDIRLLVAGEAPDDRPYVQELRQRIQAAG